MFKRLMSIFEGTLPLQKAAERFTEMLDLCREMLAEADAVYWGKELTPEERTALYDKDVQVNRLERQIRKAVVTHLSGAVPSDVPFGLLLMSLVKDVERLGDYAKNVAEIPTQTGLTDTTLVQRGLPDDEVVGELRQITRSIMTLATEAPRVYAGSDDERARQLTVEGRAIAKRCDKLLGKIASSEYKAATAVDLVLAVRFYKRIQGHLLNLLSSLLMPLHKLDYYDESLVNKD